MMSSLHRKTVREDSSQALSVKPQDLINLKRIDSVLGRGLRAEPIRGAVCV